jgi:hypothetical protein
VKLLVSGGAPLAPHVEDFLKVAMCAPVVQVRTVFGGGGRGGCSKWILSPQGGTLFRAVFFGVGGGCSKWILSPQGGTLFRFVCM